MTTDVVAEDEKMVEEAPPAVTYRNAKPTDAVAIFALLRKMHEELPGVLAPIDDGKAIMVVLQTIREGLVFVAICDRRIVGSIGIVNQQPWWSSENEPSDLWWYALPEHRAAGVGTGLLRMVRDAYPEGRLRLSDVAGAAVDDRLDALYRRVAGLSRIGGIYMRGS